MAKNSGSSKTVSKKFNKINETGRRKTNERRCDPQAEGIQTQERRKVQRRRQIDPTTCEREYTQDEVEFMQALDEYKRRSGRMFPTCSEILEVLKALGYSKAEAEYAISELDLCPAEGGR